LIEVPYWWDEKDSSLMATIYRFRPDITFEGRSVNPSLAITTAQPAKPHYDVRLNTHEEWSQRDDVAGWYFVVVY
jgi:hypothetical protein